MLMAQHQLEQQYYSSYQFLYNQLDLQPNFAEYLHHQIISYNLNSIINYQHSHHIHTFCHLIFISILYNLPYNRMSIHRHPRKWTSQFIQECAALYPATTAYSLQHKQSTSRTSASMSQLRKSSPSQMYSSSSSYHCKYDGSQVAKATKQMKNSLSRLSCAKCGHVKQCSSALTKKGKENWKQAEKEQKYVVANVQTMPVQPITNTIHTVHTLFIPAPSPQIIPYSTPIIYPQPAPRICLQSNPLLPQRPVSAPKVSINYLSPPSYPICYQPIVVPYGLSVL